MNEQVVQEAKYDHDIHIHPNIYIIMKEQHFVPFALIVLQRGRKLVEVLAATEQDRVTIQYATPHKREFTLVWLGVQDSKLCSYIAETEKSANLAGNTVYYYVYTAHIKDIRDFVDQLRA